MLMSASFGARPSPVWARLQGEGTSGLGFDLVNDAPRRQPEQHAPPVARLRVRYAKRGRARFASHRDVARAFERALRRADVPMASTSGFNPHQRVSYANSSPTGAASEAEYLELALSRHCEPGAVMDALNAALPDGIVVVDVVPAWAGGLADALTASAWRLRVEGVPRPVLERAVRALLDAERVEVERLTRNGVRAFDVRGAIIALAVESDDTLGLLSHHAAPLVRPDDVLAALSRVEPAFVPAQPPLLTRLAQGCWDGVSLSDPFAGRGEPRRAGE